MMKHLFFICAITVLLFSSCEDNMILRSEKKLKKELQGTWQREFLGDTSIHYDELWIFTGDKFYSAFIEHDPPDLVDNGTKDSTLNDNVDTAIVSGFKVDARILNAFLKFQLIDRGNDTTVFFDKWEIVELDKNVLYLATDHPISNTVEQREFFKIK
jgi:hypothetical protein